MAPGGELKGADTGFKNVADAMLAFGVV